MKYVKIKIKETETLDNVQVLILNETQTKPHVVRGIKPPDSAWQLSNTSFYLGSHRLACDLNKK